MTSSVRHHVTTELMVLSRRLDSRLPKLPRQNSATFSGDFCKTIEKFLRDCCAFITRNCISISAATRILSARLFIFCVSCHSSPPSTAPSVTHHRWAMVLSSITPAKAECSTGLTITPAMPLRCAHSPPASEPSSSSSSSPFSIIDVSRSGFKRGTLLSSVAPD